MNHQIALWCSPVAEIGGVARHVLDAVRVGVPGWRIVLVCPEGPLADQAHALGTPVITAPVSPADGTLTAVAALRRVLRKVRPDLLHTHLAFADLIGVAAVAGLRSGRGQRIRLVSTEHGIAGVKGYYQSSRASATVKAAAHRARLHRTDAIIAVSDSTRDQIRAQWGAGAPVTVVRNGVDAPGDAPEPQPGLRILSLARLAPEKRIDQVIDAFALVAAEHPTARLTIAGTGPEEGALRARAIKLGLDDAVHFPGHIDAHDALVQSDVVVQLSDWENLSYTLLDGVAYGLGVVATDVGGNGEIVPAHCLVDGRETESAARAIIEQGLQISSRPGASASALAGTAVMTTEIAAVYSGVFE